MLTSITLSIACIFVGGCDHHGQEAPHEESCNWRLERMATGIADCIAENGAYPRDQTGPNGDKHSWRVVVAPYAMAHSGIAHVLSEYDYHLDQPWSSKQNSEAVEMLHLAAVFTCRADPLGPGFTSYLMLVRPTSEDGTAAVLPLDAVIIVESASCGIRYAEPGDLSWESLWSDASPFGRGKLNSLHPRVVKALRVDGKVIDIPKNVNREELRRLLNGSSE